MPRPRPSLVLGLAAAVALPLVAVSAPAGAQPATAAPAGAPSATAAAPGPSPAGRRALQRAVAQARPGLSAALPEPPAPSALYVSDGVRSRRVALTSTGTSAGVTTDTTRTDVVVSPGGDAYAYRPTSGSARVVVRSTDTTAETSYPASGAPVVWGPLGEAFLEKTAGEWVAQATNPSFEPLATDLPAGADDPAVTPYGGIGFVRVPVTGGDVDLQRVGMPFAGSATTTGTFRLGLTAYAPGPAGVGQEPGTGVYPDNDGLTYVAFLGTVPGSSPAQGRLFVDQQTGDPAGPTGGYGAPVAVIDTGYPCDVAAPTFSPDRRSIAYVRSVDAACTTFEVRSVKAGSNGRYVATTSSTLLVPAAVTTAPTVLSWQAANPAALPLRSEGANRYEVAANVAYAYYPDGESKTVVLAGGQAYADALTGGALGVARQGADGTGAGPTLLTPAASLHPWAQEEIVRVLAPGGTVYIMGGTASVSSAVEQKLKSLGLKTKRMAGASRFDVAVAVAKELELVRGTTPRAAFLSSGRAFADALVAGPPAALYDAPILLSNGSTLPASTKAYLDSLGSDASLFAIGGAGAASIATDPRTEVISGASRYDVAGNVAQRFFGYTWISGVADGRNWPDAASGGTFMASVLEPILLTDGTSTLPSATSRYLLQSRASADYVLAFGGTSSVPAATLAAAVAAAGRQTTSYGPELRPEG